MGARHRRRPGTAPAGHGPRCGNPTAGAGSDRRARWQEAAQALPTEGRKNGREKRRSPSSNGRTGTRTARLSSASIKGKFAPLEARPADRAKVPLGPPRPRAGRLPLQRDELFHGSSVRSLSQADFTMAHSFVDFSLFFFFVHQKEENNLPT